jgi:hypothetical protein
MGGNAREAGDGPAKQRCTVVEDGQDNGIMRLEWWVMRGMRHTTRRRIAIRINNIFLAKFGGNLDGVGFRI